MKIQLLSERDSDKAAGEGVYPTKAVCQTVSFRRRYEVLSNRAIPFPNEIQILLAVQIRCPKLHFEKLGCFYATLKYMPYRSRNFVYVNSNSGQYLLN